MRLRPANDRRKAALPRTNATEAAMHRPFMLALLIAPLLLSSAGAQAPPPARPAAPRAAAPSPSLPAADRRFLDEATRGGFAEVELGRMAMDLGHDQLVSAYGRDLVEDHGRFNDHLLAIARAYGPPPSTAPTKEEMALQDRLSQLQGTSFDREFLGIIENQHRRSVVLYHSEAVNGSDPVLRRVGSDGEVMQRRHLDGALRIESDLGIPPQVGAR
jgi:putative membrane protein